MKKVSILVVAAALVACTACDEGDHISGREKVAVMAAEVEDDAEIRHTLLVDAHDAAKRSHASQPDHSTQLLVEQIARAVKALEK